MKRLLLLLLFFIIDIECTHYALKSCPTCVGNGKTTRTPFFSDESYRDITLDSLDLSETNTSSLNELNELDQ